MSSYWQTQFRERMEKFVESSNSHAGTAISIKVRITSGCFHREHSPLAYQTIDRQLKSIAPKDFCFEEHESGPEILTWVQLTTAGIAFSAAVISLVTAIIKARSDGIKKGDGPSAPVELVVRGLGSGDTYFEETILHIPPGKELSAIEIESLLKQALSKQKPVKAKKVLKKAKRKTKKIL